MFFESPTKGRLSFEQMFGDVEEFVEQDPRARYKLIVGTDSQVREKICFVTAVVILRVGKGGRFYYIKEFEKIQIGLKQRIFLETSRSLALASKLAERLAADGMADLNVEIHLDVGEDGRTRDVIREVVGMVTGSGFDARIKPESYGASTVADKYTK